MTNLLSCKNAHTKSRGFFILLTMVLSFSLVTFFSHPSAQAAEQDTGSQTSEAGLGVASALLTIPYGVAKIVYAGLGGVVGGLTWVLTGGDTETAAAIWEPSFYGTYVITPDHLKGNEPVRFFGISPYDEQP